MIAKHRRVHVIDSHTGGEPTRLVVGGRIIPTIRGTASVNAEADLILDEQDPFCWGIRK